MRILEVVTSFYPNIGGSEIFSDQLTQRLVANFDVDCLILHAERSGSRSTETRTSSVPVVSFASHLSISSTPIGLDWYQQAREVISNHNPDLIHMALPLPGLVDVVAQVARRTGIPVVLTYHNDIVGWSPIQGLAAFVYNTTLGARTLRAVTRIVVDSDHYARSSLWLAPYRHKTTSIPPGLADEFLQRSDLPDFATRSKAVIFVGRLEPGAGYKGLPVLLKAVSILRRSDKSVQLTIVGTGRWEDRYQRMASQLDLDGAVEFTGGISRNALIVLLRRHKVLALPSTSRAEGFGIVLLEAQSQGLPVVASSIGGLPDAMLDGGTGQLVPPSDPEALAGAIAHLLNDPSLWTRLSRGAVRFSTRFSWDAIAQEYHLLFQSVLEQARGKSYDRQAGG